MAMVGATESIQLYDDRCLTSVIVGIVSSRPLRSVREILATLTDVIVEWISNAGVIHKYNARVWKQRCQYDQTPSFLSSSFKNRIRAWNLRGRKRSSDCLRRVGPALCTIIAQVSRHDSGHLGQQAYAE